MCISRCVVHTHLSCVDVWGYYVIIVKRRMENIFLYIIFITNTLLFLRQLLIFSIWKISKPKVICNFNCFTSFSRISILTILARKAWPSWWSLFSLGPRCTFPTRFSWRSRHCADGHWWTGRLVQDSVVAWHVTWKRDKKTGESQVALWNLLNKSNTWWTRKADQWIKGKSLGTFDCSTTNILQIIHTGRKVWLWTTE